MDETLLKFSIGFIPAQLDLDLSSFQGLSGKVCFI